MWQHREKKRERERGRSVIAGGGAPPGIHFAAGGEGDVAVPWSEQGVAGVVTHFRRRGVAASRKSERERESATLIDGGGEAPAGFHFPTGGEGDGAVVGAWSCWQQLPINGFAFSVFMFIGQTKVRERVRERDPYFMRHVRERERPIFQETQKKFS